MRRGTVPKGSPHRPQAAMAAAVTSGPGRARAEPLASRGRTSRHRGRDVQPPGDVPRPRVRPTDERVVEHAALASPARLRLLDLLLASPTAAHVDDLAAALHLHPSTVRGHLQRLDDAGFVEQSTEHSPRPGRPRVRYRPTAKARVGTAGCLGYRTLAHVLTSYLDGEARDPAATGERAGVAWAAHLTRQEPDGRRSRDEALERFRAVLESVGFCTDVETSGEQVVVRQHTCPFAAVVESHGSIVCGLHRGLLQGVLDGVGAQLAVDELTRGVPERVCVARLRSTLIDW
jgi:predicted ArsR family transcriptional regulator